MQVSERTKLAAPPDYGQLGAGSAGLGPNAAAQQARLDRDLERDIERATAGRPRTAWLVRQSGWVLIGCICIATLVISWELWHMFINYMVDCDVTE